MVIGIHTAEGKGTDHGLYALVDVAYHGQTTDHDGYAMPKLWKRRGNVARNT